MRGHLGEIVRSVPPTPCFETVLAFFGGLVILVISTKTDTGAYEDPHPDAREETDAIARHHERVRSTEMRISPKIAPQRPPLGGDATPLVGNVQHFLPPRRNHA